MSSSQSFLSPLFIKPPISGALLILGLALWLAACDDASSTKDVAPDLPPVEDLGDDAIDADLPPEEVDPGDTAVDAPETELPPGDVDPDLPDLPPPTQAAGEPCNTSAECLTGYCLLIAGETRCATPCTGDGDCLELGDLPLTCKQVVNPRGEEDHICATSLGTLCSPCVSDANCPGGACIRMEGRPYCGFDCTLDEDCPQGTLCREFQRFEDYRRVRQCVPANLTCDCHADNHGEERTCSRTSDDTGFYACLGIETCDQARGWVDCTAATPTEEVCDGVDNDCNGAIDDGLDASRPCSRTAEGFPNACEGVEICMGEAGWVCNAPVPSAETCNFRDNDCNGIVDDPFVNDDGLYHTDDHCGTCNSPCADRFALAAATHCEIMDGAAICVIDACIEGYILQSFNTCVPLASRLCSPCNDDADCNQSVGDLCLPYADGQSYCGRSCSPSSPFGTQCPPGYVCDGAAQQCILPSGSCACGPTDSFVRPCTQANPTLPNVTCVGTQTCTNGTLSACIFPTEVCDGTDNDCNGVIDDPFIDAQGRYHLNGHCGQCNYDCATVLAGVANAAPYCSVSTGQAQCAIQCHTNYYDVDGVLSNGCECQWLAALDPPDHLGQDANCDGIDGEVDRGIFVSPGGNDTNPGTITAPVRTIQRGIDLARDDAQRDHVYVANGVYTESIAIENGVSVFGGYSSDFRRRNPSGYETAIFGLPSTPALPGTVNVVGLTLPTRLDGFTIVAADATTPGSSSYGVYVRNTGDALSFTYNVVYGGNGAAGLPGPGGPDGLAATASGTHGLAPISVGEIQAGAWSCTAAHVPRLGAPGAAFSCPLPAGGTTPTTGGGGADAICPVANTAGAAGGTSPGNPGASGATGGFGGTSQPTGPSGGICDCYTVAAPYVGGNGQRGNDGNPGSAGAACTGNLGRVIGGLWVAGVTDAGAGTPGFPASGGGGGGVGGGVHNNSTNATCTSGATRVHDMVGGTGGAGGAGGCGGNPGQAGQGGGGSFAIFVVFDAIQTSFPHIANNTIHRGRGGDGGDGGAGGEGGIGSLGGSGTKLPLGGPMNAESCAAPGGRGGDGGQGGPGGGGGGGCGGSTFGIFTHNVNATPNWQSTNTFPSSGNVGLGGRGGASRGNPGLDGVNGTNLTVKL